MSSQERVKHSALLLSTKVKEEHYNPKILLVKLSSLGDILHNLPIVWDLRKQFPYSQIDWIVEEAYVDLLAPLQTTEDFRGIDRIIPIAFRRWRKSLFLISTWREFFGMRKTLHAVTYDVVLETQGLLKSALICALAKKTNTSTIAGLGNATEHSGYEPLAKIFYSQRIYVPKRSHAVDRSRRVMCLAFRLPVINKNDEPPLFYPAEFVKQLPTLPIAGLQKDANNTLLPYIVCFHSTARAAKRWPNEYWVELGQALSDQGFQMLFPWGNDAEKTLSIWIANKIPRAIVPTSITIREAFSLIAHASLTIGVDTGLTHLAATLGKPTVEIYCDSPKWKTEGYWSNRISNHGDIKNVPSVQEIFNACCNLIKIRNERNSA